MNILKSLFIIFFLLISSFAYAEDITAGSTDVTMFVELENTSDGQVTTGVASGSVTATYYRTGDLLPTPIILSPLLANNDAHSDGGWIELSSTSLKGLYRIDLPDAAVASGASHVVLSLESSGSFIYNERFKLVTASGGGGGSDVLTIEGVDATDQIDARVAAQLAAYDGPTNAEMEARTIPAADYFDPVTDGVQNVVNVGVVGVLTGHTPQTGDNFARLGAPAGASVSADIADVKSDTSTIVATTSAIGVGGAGLNAIPWNSSWDTEVQSETDDALRALQLDHIFAEDYNPAVPPGVATAWANELVENNGVGVTRFTAVALTQAPTGGGGGGGDVTTIEGVDATDQIDARVAAQLAAYDGPTNAEMEARTIASASYFDPATDTVATVTTVTNAVTTGPVTIAAGQSIDTVATVTNPVTANPVTIAAGQSVDSVSNPVTVGTNNDKLGYSLAAGQSVDSVTNPVTVGTNNDKTGYSLASGQVVADVTNPVTVGTNNDKTGYSISGTITTLDGLNNLSSSDVQTASETAIETYELDKLFVTQYNPATPPGVGNSLLNSVFENDGGVPRYTANALENGPSGSAIRDWLNIELEQIRYRLGIDGAKSAPVSSTPQLGGAIGGGGSASSDTNR